MTRLLTLGTFDLFHAGHVAFLRHCRALAGSEGRVIVGLNTDRFAESYKRLPVIPYAEREAVLLACRLVDDVYPNDQPGGSARALIEALAPHAVAATMDYHPSNGKDWFAQIGTSVEWFREQGIGVEWIPYTAGVSSTGIRSRL